MEERPSGSGRNASGPLRQESLPGGVAMRLARCAHAPPAHLDGRHGRRSRCRAARASASAVPSAAISSCAAQLAAVAQGACATLVVVDARCELHVALDQHGARAAARPAGTAIAARALDDVPQIRLAELGAIEASASPRPRGSPRGIPDAHALVGDDTRCAGSAATRRTALQQPLRGAAQRKHPQVPVGVRRRRSARTLIGDERHPPARAQPARQQAGSP